MEPQRHYHLTTDNWLLGIKHLVALWRIHSSWSVSNPAYLEGGLRLVLTAEPIPPSVTCSILALHTNKKHLLNVHREAFGLPISHYLWPSYVTPYMGFRWGPWWDTGGMVLDNGGIEEGLIVDWLGGGPITWMFSRSDAAHSYGRIKRHCAGNRFNVSCCSSFGW